MTAEPDLLPMSSTLLNWPHPTNHEAIRDYARANVAHATAEIEALRAESWNRVRELEGAIITEQAIRAEWKARAERLRAEVRERDASLGWWGRFASGEVNARKEAEARAERLAEALRWYAEQAQLCRKFGSEGDAARHALSADGGKRANDALAQEDRND